MATATTFTFTNFNRVPKPWAGGPILLPDKVSVQVGYAAAANIAPKPFSALDAANSASGLYSAQNVAAAAASQGASDNVIAAEEAAVIAAANDIHSKRAAEEAAAAAEEAAAAAAEAKAAEEEAMLAIPNSPMIGAAEVADPVAALVASASEPNTATNISNAPKLAGQIAEPAEVTAATTGVDAATVDAAPVTAVATAIAPILKPVNARLPEDDSEEPKGKVIILSSVKEIVDHYDAEAAGGTNPLATLISSPSDPSSNTDASYDPSKAADRAAPEAAARANSSIAAKAAIAAAAAAAAAASAHTPSTIPVNARPLSDREDPDPKIIVFGTVKDYANYYDTEITEKPNPASIAPATASSLDPNYNDPAKAADRAAAAAAAKAKSAAAANAATVAASFRPPPTTPINARPPVDDSEELKGKVIILGSVKDVVNYYDAGAADSTNPLAALIASPIDPHSMDGSNDPTRAADRAAADIAARMKSTPAATAAAAAASAAAANTIAPHTPVNARPLDDGEPKGKVIVLGSVKEFAGYYDNEIAEKPDPVYASAVSATAYSNDPSKAADRAAAEAALKTKSAAAINAAALVAAPTAAPGIIPINARSLLDDNDVPKGKVKILGSVADVAKYYDNEAFIGRPVPRLGVTISTAPDSETDASVVASAKYYEKEAFEPKPVPKLAVFIKPTANSEADASILSSTSQSDGIAETTLDSDDPASVLVDQVVADAVSPESVVEAPTYAAIVESLPAETHSGLIEPKSLEPIDATSTAVVEPAVADAARGGIIEEDDGGVITERLHKPSEEKRAPQFSGNTIQSRSFNVLEETLAAEGDIGPPPTTIDYQTGEIILKSQPKPTAGPKVSHAFSVNDPMETEPSRAITPVAAEQDQPLILGAHAIPALPDVPHVQLGTPVAFTVVPSPALEPYIPGPTVPEPTVPIVATSNVSVTKRPKSAESKESRQVKRLSSSGEEPSHCTQSRSFRALEQLLFEGDDSAALDAAVEAPAAAEVADTPL